MDISSPSYKYALRCYYSLHLSLILSTLFQCSTGWRPTPMGACFSVSVSSVTCHDRCAHGCRREGKHRETETVVRPILHCTFLPTDCGCRAKDTKVGEGTYAVVYRGTQRPPNPFFFLRLS